MNSRLVSMCYFATHGLTKGTEAKVLRNAKPRQRLIVELLEASL